VCLFGHSLNKFEGQATAKAGGSTQSAERRQPIGLRGRSRFETAARSQVRLGGLDACATAHHWARELTKLGHEVRLHESRLRGAFQRAYDKVRIVLRARNTINQPFGPMLIAVRKGPDASRLPPSPV